MKIIFTILLLLAAQTAFTQKTAAKPIIPAVTMELSIAHDDYSPVIRTCSSHSIANIILHNNTDSLVRFYENWTSYGFYNFHFELVAGDSVYQIVRPHKLWYRNFPAHHSINPNESLVFSFMLINTMCTEFFPDENGWLGFPRSGKTGSLRVVYELAPEDRFYEVDRLDFDMLNPDTEIDSLAIANLPVKKNTVYLFSERLVSNTIPVLF